MTHGRSYVLEASPVHPCGTYIVEFSLCRGLTQGRSYRVSEASPVHPCGTYIVEFSLCRGLTQGRSYRVFEASPIHPCGTYSVEFSLCRGLTRGRSYRVSEASPVLLSYTVVDIRKISEGIIMRSVRYTTAGLYVAECVVPIGDAFSLHISLTAP